MKFDNAYLQQLLQNPSESLTVEIKNWIDPKSPEGISKIARACIALRNNNGGCLIIGFDDKTLKPDKDNIPSNVRSTYHMDIIQGIISKYASQSFEVEVKFIEHEGQEFPIICVEEGIVTPVAAKSALQDPQRNNKWLIRENKIYVRSLHSNNTVSTSEPKNRDWERLMNICFDNREADIAKFIRRHLRDVDINSIFSELNKVPKPEPSLREKISEFANINEKRFRELLKEREHDLPELGTWETSSIVNGRTKNLNNRDFLNLISSNNPKYTGWPVWVDSRGFANNDHRPFFYENGWEALIYSKEEGWRDTVDFWRIEATGKFYLIRVLEDDLLKGENRPDPLTVFDLILPMWRASEAIAVSLAFAREMVEEVDKSYVSCLMRWKKLKNRRLVSWSDSRRSGIIHRQSYQDEVTSYIEIPVEIPESAIFQYTTKLVKPLYEIFDGYEIPEKFVEEQTKQLLERRY